MKKLILLSTLVTVSLLNSFGQSKYRGYCRYEYDKNNHVVSTMHIDDSVSVFETNSKIFVKIGKTLEFHKATAEQPTDSYTQYLTTDLKHILKIYQPLSYELHYSDNETKYKYTFDTSKKDRKKCNVR